VGMDKNPLVVIEKLQQAIDSLIKDNNNQFKKAYENGDLIIAEETLHKMHFAYKLQSELELIYDNYDS
jgi:hypothetical protein